MSPRSASGSRTDVEIEGRHLTLSNLEKLLYPATGFTKAQVIDYYIRISGALLPHLRGRPLTLKRYPNGVDAAFFYEKQCPSHRPEWVKTTPIWSGDNGRTIDYCLADDLPTLVWLANLATLELHPLLSRAPAIDCPTSVVFDLDPGPPANVVDCADVALALRDLFGHLKLQVFPKTSGSKGMQVYLPLNTSTTYDETKPFARAVAQALERQMPSQVVSNMNKALRTGKVFVDWSQNDGHKTTIAVYSLRARDLPAVSTPLAWDEVEAAAAHRDPALLTFEPDAVIARFEAHGDLFAPLNTVVQALPTL